MKKYFLPLGVLGIFMIVAVTLWLTQGNIFYLFNFSYIGISISFGIFLYVKKYKYARRVAQLLVGLIISRRGIRSGTLFRSIESLLRTSGSPLRSARQQVISCF